MDRYSTIRGTIASGAEMRLGESEGLSEFLQSQGALDSNSVLQVVDTQLRGFERLAGYETEMQNQKPVAVRYAPMHLYKIRGMERMRPFCALSVNGVENREDRVSQYSQTFIFSHQQALQGKDGYQYLDMLFGTELLSWKTLELYRKGRAPLECDSPLRKVTPRIEAHDLTMVLKTVEAIYQRKNVVIQLEPDLSFNDRAMSLLAGIYSLLQPRLAIEVGYATYQRAADIAKIVERNSIRIFVLPAGESLSQIPDSFLILDMAKAPVPVQKTPLMETLVKWVQIPWEQRQSAMLHLFKDERDYQDAELFIQKSTEFFNAMSTVERWNHDSSKNGTISSIEELYAEYEAQPSHDVPWFEQMFREKIGKLIGKQNTLDKLNAQTAVKLLITTGEEQQHAREMYLFGRKFGNVDVGELCQLVSDHQKSEDDKAHAVEVAALNADLEKTKETAAATLLQVKTEAAAALAAEQENTRKAVEDGNAAVAEEKKIAAAALAAEQENTRKAVEAGNAAVAAEQEKAAAALAAEQENTRKAVADGIAAVNAAKASAAEVLAREQEIARIAVEVEKANTRKAVEDGEAAVAAEKEKTATVQQEKAQLRAKAIAALNEEKNRTKEAQTALEQEQERHRQTKENAQTLAAQNKSLQQNLRQEQKNAEDLNLILDHTRQERDAALAQISKAESLANQALEEKEAMQKEQEIALLAAAEAKQKLDNYKRGKYNKKLLATGGIAGLLAGALTIGALWLCISLLGKNEEPVVTPPTQIATATVETEPVETTQETQIPTTETEPPVMNNRIDSAVLSLLPTQVPTLKTVKMDRLELWIPEALPQEGENQVLALLTTAEALPEDAKPSDFSYALLVEHNDATENESGASDDIPADLKLSTEQYILMVFGDESMQYAAIQAFDYLIPEETPTAVKWGALNLNELVIEVLGDANWWRRLDSFSLQAPETDSAAAPADISQQPALYLCCSEHWIYVYNCTEAPELISELNTLAETETYHVVQQGDFVALAVK